VIVTGAAMTIKLSRMRPIAAAYGYRPVSMSLARERTKAR
jgi:hypothetical protein